MQVTHSWKEYWLGDVGPSQQITSQAHNEDFPASNNIGFARFVVSARILPEMQSTFSFSN